MKTYERLLDNLKAESEKSQQQQKVTEATTC